MALNKQVHVYSVDTSAFYTQDEKEFSERMSRLYFKRSAIKKIPKDERSELEVYRYRMLNKHIKNGKERLKEKFKSKKEVVRMLDYSHLKDSNIVSVFESFLTRTADFKINDITKDIIIIRAFYFDILESCITNGFILDGEKYILFTASSGQIRTKKTVFIKESLWNNIENTLTCGLDSSKINNNGGMNVNKYLAYLALTNSATDLWEGFNIDKTIVVDDFETTFKTYVDFINEETYDIIPKVERDVTIPHMDGCGIMLPKVNKKPFMIRMPWVKGLLVPFRYDAFLKQHGLNSTKIKDIYGKEYDIIKDDIHIIFTKSQFKTSKYYKSWDDYKENFKKYNCTAGMCNEEPQNIKNANINYQMLQTLEDMEDQELVDICEKLNEDIFNISRDRDTMLRVLGVNDNNENKSYLQQALKIYPELLKDEHCKSTLREIRRKKIKEGRAGKLPIDGKYTFIIPDLYAFCEWLFLKQESPKGLLKNGEVSCKIYQNEEELDILRAPHLYMEHAIRINKIDIDTKKWFTCNGVYTSIHDPISRILQFDVDGDKSLVVRDKTVIKVGKRNIKKHKILPLYYDMKKADAQLIEPLNIYNGLINAYSGGNIGAISNDITKIWNSDGDIEEKLQVIKFLCMENNFVIDYAKTLYKPTRPKEINDMIRKYTKNKVPKFFVYAKDKKPHQVEPRNKSTVNRLYKKIKTGRFKFDDSQLGNFDYKNLKNNKNRKITNNDNELIKRYDILNRNKSRFDYDARQYIYTYQKIKNELLELNNDPFDVLDVLIEYVFTRSASRLLIFECFGSEIVENLNENIKNKIGKEYIMCERCGVRVKKSSNKMKYCKKCSKEKHKENKLFSWHKNKNQHKTRHLENL